MKSSRKPLLEGSQPASARCTHMESTVALLLLSMLLAATLQVPAPPTAAIPPQLTVKVEKASLKVVVHPDGSVEPIYTAEGYILLPANTSITGNGIVTVEGKTETDSSVERGQADVAITFYTSELEENLSSLNLQVKGSWNGMIRNGILTSIIAFTYNGPIPVNNTFTIDNGTLTLSVHMKVDKEKAKLKLTGSIKPYEAFTGVGEGPNTEAAKSFKKLRDILINAFADNVTVTYGVTATGKALLTLELTADLNREADYLLRSGVPPNVANALIKYMNTLESRNISIDYDGNTSITVNVKRSGDTVTLKVKASYLSTAGGTVEEYEKTVVEYSSLIGTHLAALIVSLLKDVYTAMGYEETAKNLATMLIALSTAYTGPQMLLYTKPPTQSRIAVMLNAYNNMVKFRIALDAGKLAYLYSKGDPSTDASLALSELAHYLTNMKKTLTMLAMLATGVSDLIPQTVTLEPATKEVSLSEQTVTIDELPAVKVAITPVTATTATETKTATPPATTATITQTPTQTPQTRTMATENTTTKTTPKETETETTVTTPSEKGVDLTLAIIAGIIVAIAVAFLAYSRRR